MSAATKQRPANPSLFEIASEFKQMEHQLRQLDLDEQTINDTLEAESGDLVDKLAAVMAVALSMEAEANMIDMHVVQRAMRRVESLCRRAARLREYALDAMVACNKVEVSQPDLRFRLRDNPASCVIDDPEKVPDLYKTTEEIPATTKTVIDKAAIKLACKNGVSVPGAHIEVKKRIEVL